HFRNASIEDALEACLKNQALSYEITDKSVVIQESPSARLPDEELLSMPPFLITVTDNLGRPLPGATIVLNRQSKGLTDDKGVFNLSVKEGDVLNISYVGYEMYVLKLTS